MNNDLVDNSQELITNLYESSAPVLHSLEENSQKGNQVMRMSKLPLVLALVAVMGGVGTGWGVNRLSAGSSSSTGNGPTPLQRVAGENIKAGDVFGMKDEQTFKDSAEGYLETGGIEGEGSHHLLRPGGESQTIYLTSSVTDLDKFVGMEIKIWGETFKGQKAGWLMDVGRVQVINTQGTSPAEE